MKSGIYQIRNLLNNKIYVGSTKNLIQREKIHFKDLKRGFHHCYHLQMAYNKYGKDNFIFEVLMYCSLDNLIQTEQLFFDTYKPEYNSSKTAGSPLGMKRNKEFCINNSNLKKGNKNCIGRVLSDETKIKIRNGQKLSSVNQYDSNDNFIQNWQSMMDIERSLKIDQASIWRCCNNLQKTAGKFKWRYNET